jgi:hypothetical protein
VLLTQPDGTTVTIEELRGAEPTDTIEPVDSTGPLDIRQAPGGSEPC